MIRAIDAGRIVHRIGVDASTAQIELDPTQFGDSEVAALADDLDPQLVPVHADRVVRLVPHRFMRLGARLHIRSDAAVPQQIGGSEQDGADQFRG